MATTTLTPVAASAPVRPRRFGTISRITLAIVVMAIAVALVVWLARTSGPSWVAVSGRLGQVGLVDLGMLTVVWAVGLWCHSWVLTAALPGLSRRRALLLNISGSAVSDLMPFGAAAGTGINLAMVRSWNYSLTRYASFTTIHNLWNVTAKLGLPAVVLTLTLADGTIQSAGLALTAKLALAATAILGVVAAAAIAEPRIAAILGRTADRIVHLGWRMIGSARTTRLAQTLPAIRSETAAVIRRGWPQLTAGMLGYLVMQAVLWSMCLHAVGAVPAPRVLLAGFAVERVLSMLPFTPGGAGLAEAGSIAVLVSLGGDSATMAAGVLLYRGFAFLLEIPVGGAGLLAWFWLQRRRRLSRPLTARPVTAP